MAVRNALCCVAGVPLGCRVSGQRGHSDNLQKGKQGTMDGLPAPVIKWLVWKQIQHFDGGNFQIFYTKFNAVSICTRAVYVLWMGRWQHGGWVGSIPMMTQPVQGRHAIRLVDLKTSPILKSGNGLG